VRNLSSTGMGALSHLSYWGIEDFHLVDLRNQLGRENGGLCAGSFGRIIHESNLRGIAAGVLDEDFDFFYGRRMRSAPISKYHLCFELVLDLICEDVMDFHPGDAVSIFFDNDVKPPDASLAIFEYFQRARKTENALQSLTIGSRKQFIGLQCADLCAGVWRKQWAEGHFSEAMPNSTRDTGSFGKQTRSIYWTLENLNDHGIVTLKRMAAGIP
jgi:hypothetical protein